MEGVWRAPGRATECERRKCLIIIDYWSFMSYHCYFFYPAKRDLSRDTIKSWVFRTLYYYCLPGSVLFSFVSPSPPCGGLKSKFLDTPQCNSRSVLFSCSLPPARFDLISPAGVISRPVGALSRGPLPGYKRVSKWRLQLQDSPRPPYFHKDFTPFFTPHYL